MYEHRSLRFSLLLLSLVLVLIASPLLGQADRAVPPDLKPADPIACSGNDRVVLRGRTIDTVAAGVQVYGNCSVKIVDSHIVARGIGVLAQGRGRVELTNSTVEGGRLALLAEGLGEITYRETTLRGGTRVTGRGQIHGDDGAVHGRASGGTLGGLLGGDVRITGRGLEVRSGDDTVTIGREGVVVDDGNETVTVRPGEDGLRIETGDVAVVLDADVVVDGNLLRLGMDASVEISGDWRSAGSSVYTSSDTERLLVELGASEEAGELHLGLAGDVLFALDSSEVLAAGAAELRKLAHVLRQRAGGEIRLVGHTDSLGTDEHNLKLSQARAVSVMRWLHREEGVPAAMMVGEGAGSKKPVAYNTLPDGSDNPQGRARNRRVEIYFVAR